MSRILIAPSRYVQGQGAIHEIGLHAARLGTKALVTGGKRALAACGEAIQASLKEKNLSCVQELFNGECCDNEINRLVALARRVPRLSVAKPGAKIPMKTAMPAA